MPIASITTRNSAIGHKSGAFGQPVALQQNPAHDAQEMRERQAFADVLRPARHPAKRKHVARQQDVRQKEKHAHLHRLALVSAMVEKVMPTARFATINTNASRSSNGTLPTMGTSNKKLAASRIKNICM